MRLCPSAVRTAPHRAALLFLGALLGCDAASPPADVTTGEPATGVGGTLVVATVAEPDLLVPALTLTGTGQQVVDAVFDRLAVPDADAPASSALRPQLARRWRWAPESPVLDVVLTPEARWHDGVPVTAHDVAFTWRAYTDSMLASPTASLLADIDSVVAIDDTLARFWMGRSTARAERAALSLMRVMPRHRWDSIARPAWRTAADARAPIGSGRFRFATWQAGARVVVTADSGSYRGRPGLDRVVWSVSADPTATLARLRAGEVDFIENVRPDAVPQFATDTASRLLTSPSYVYGYATFNLRARTSSTAPHPVLGDVRMRRALALAIDRDALVRAVFDSLARVALGPFTRAQLGARSPAPGLGFDPDHAAALFDSIGWRRDRPDAPRQRAGVPLSLRVLVPSSSPPRVRLAQLLQDSWRGLGIDVTIDQLEFNTVNARLAAGDFDVAMMAIGADPDPLAIRGLWSQEADRTRGGPNFGGYASATFDSLLAVAAAASDLAAEQAALDRAYRTILADAPAIWLFEPWNVAAVRREIQPAGLQADGWWFALGDWRRVPPR